MTNLLATFEKVLKALEKEEIEYMVVGSIASVIYGEPRVTRDLDLVVELRDQPARKLHAAFSENEYYLPPDEVISNEVTEHGQFNLIHPESGLKVDFIMKKPTPHGIEEFKRRQKLEFTPGFFAWIASPEDIILKKLSYFREGGSEKHLTDIRGILAQTEVDQSYLTHWIEKLSLELEWKKVD